MVNAGSVNFISQMMNMSHLFPYPEANPLERLRIRDGLVMNADYWRLAHNYHSQRQSVVYQALCQPGIVYGLGITILEEPPEDSNKTFQDRDRQRREKRWIEIQPGVAIDHYGNPIVVDEKTDRSYRIAFDGLEDRTRIIYVVVRYVNPEQLEPISQADTMHDCFRFGQRTDPPECGEVELCRIELGSGPVVLESPTNPFAPAINQIDVKYRLQAQFRSQTHLQIGTLQQLPDPTDEALKALTKSLSALFPTLQCDVHSSVFPAEQLTNYDVLYIAPESLESRVSKEFQERGGVLLLVVPDSGSVPPTWIAWENLKEHLVQLKLQPFRFTQLPQAIGVWIAPKGDAIAISQSLVTAWLGDHLTRSEIRTAHELGINILNFIRHRRQLFQALQFHRASDSSL
jgi:hypothetical protein